VLRPLARSVLIKNGMKLAVTGAKKKLMNRIAIPQRKKRLLRPDIAQSLAEVGNGGAHRQPALRAKMIN